MKTIDDIDEKCNGFDSFEAYSLILLEDTTMSDGSMSDDSSEDASINDTDYSSDSGMDTDTTNITDFSETDFIY